MYLQLTRRGDYAVRAAIHLARTDGGGYAKIPEVSQAMSVPLSYTPQVLGLLARAGLAEAKAGREGGFRLYRAPEEITLLELVEAADGFRASLAGTSLADLARTDRALAGFAGESVT